MTIESFIDSFIKYSTQLYNLLFSPALTFIAPTLFLLRISETETLAINALVFAFVADTVLGMIEALAKKKFDWDKMLRVIYKAIVYSIYLKLSQYIGDLLVQQGFESGDSVLILFVVVMFIAEAKSAVLKADQLYPNPITRPLAKLIEKISVNTEQKIDKTL